MPRSFAGVWSSAAKAASPAATSPPSHATRSAFSISLASRWRAAGCLASARITIATIPVGSSGISLPSGSGSRCTTANSTAGTVAPVNGRRPESIS